MKYHITLAEAHIHIIVDGGVEKEKKKKNTSYRKYFYRSV